MENGIYRHTIVILNFECSHNHFSSFLLLLLFHTPCLGCKSVNWHLTKRNGIHLVYLFSYGVEYSQNVGTHFHYFLYLLLMLFLYLFYARFVFVSLFVFCLSCPFHFKCIIYPAMNGIMQNIVVVHEQNKAKFPICFRLSKRFFTIHYVHLYIYMCCTYTSKTNLTKVKPASHA